ncbi:MAG TPA: hypothetical protein VLZ10_04230 [Thermodesulfobacteriota bacterium]|nr:hypothetical protein [Thermodesulfobacteriota bacterium]
MSIRKKTIILISYHDSEDMVFKLLLRDSRNTNVNWDNLKPVLRGYIEEEKKGMIFWKPKTEAEKKLLELYGVEEDDIEDQNQNRSHGDRKSKNLGQELINLAGCGRRKFI